MRQFARHSSRLSGKGGLGRESPSVAERVRMASLHQALSVPRDARGRGPDVDPAAFPGRLHAPLHRTGNSYNGLHTRRSGTMTPQPEATQATPDQANPDTAKDLSDRPLVIVMATRRATTEISRVERAVAGVVRELARVRPAWRVDVVSAFKAGSRIEGMDGFSDILAAFRLGWKLRGSTADLIFVHCPECLWGIRWLRKRQGAPPLIAVWHGAGPVPHLVPRRPGHPLAWALAWLRTTGERHALVADAHVAVHEQVEDCLRSLYGLKAPV